MAAVAREEIDHDCTDEIVCPGCGVEWGDSWEVRSDDEDLGEQECDECGCQFYATRNISVSYSTEIITAEDRERERRQKEREEAERQKWLRFADQRRFRRFAWLHFTRARKP